MRTWRTESRPWVGTEDMMIAFDVTGTVYISPCLRIHHPQTSGMVNSSSRTVIREKSHCTFFTMDSRKKSHCTFFTMIPETRFLVSGMKNVQWDFSLIRRLHSSVSAQYSAHLSARHKLSSSAKTPSFLKILYVYII